MEVIFNKKYDWAVLPTENKIDWKRKKETAELYKHNFRWIRKNRVPELCWPWRLGQEIGWQILSPIDVMMSPVETLEVNCSKDELGHFAKLSEYNELWKRESSFLATKRSNWLRLFEYRTDKGWESMFIPNGDGTVEWHLGWEIQIPKEYFLFIFPFEYNSKLEIPIGVLSSAMVDKLNASTGFSIAIHIHDYIKIKRHQPVARFILLHKSSLKVNAKHQTE